MRECDTFKTKIRAGKRPKTQGCIGKRFIYVLDGIQYNLYFDEIYIITQIMIMRVKTHYYIK